MVTAADKAKSNSDKPKKPRTVLSPAEKIAKAEAELKRLRESAHDKDRKAIAKATTERDKQVAKRDDAVKKIEALDAEILEAQGRIDGPVTDGVGEA